MKKKLFTLLLFSVTLLFAQDEKTTISLYANANPIVSFGFESEFIGIKDKHSTVIRGIYSNKSIKTNNRTYKGKGTEVKFGYRSFNDNTKKGLFFGNFLSYGNTKFKDNLYSGNYKYFSFINPEIGYKLKFGNFVAVANFNSMWKIEIKGTGNVDNKHFNNNEYRLGIGFGYSF